MLNNPRPDLLSLSAFALNEIKFYTKKAMVILVALLLFHTTLYSQKQTHLQVVQDTVKIQNAGIKTTKFVNNATEDSVLSTDVNGNFKLKSGYSLKSGSTLDNVLTNGNSSTQNIFAGSFNHADASSYFNGGTKLSYNGSDSAIINTTGYVGLIGNRGSLTINNAGNSAGFASFSAYDVTIAANNAVHIYGLYVQDNHFNMGTYLTVLAPANNTSGTFYNQWFPSGTGTLALQEWVTAQGYLSNANFKTLTAGAGFSGGTFNGSTNTTFTNNVSTGISGGQNIYGGTGSGENLTLNSTAGTAKGFINFGTGSTFDETNQRFGINTISPTHAVTLGSSANGFASYNTTDQTTNYERVVGQWQGNVYTLGSYAGGTGSPRSLQFGLNGTAGATSLATGRLFTINLNTAPTAGIFDFNANTGGLGSIATFQGTAGATTGTQNWVSIQPIINQSGPAAYTALQIAPYESATDSGNHYLINAGTTSAVNGGGTLTQKFYINNGGTLWSASSGTFVGRLSTGTATQSSQFTVLSSINQGAWGTTGVLSNFAASSVTDNSTAAGATVAGTTVINSFGRPTITASNATSASPVTYTYASNVYIAGAPLAGANTLITNPLSLHVASGNNWLGGTTTLIGSGVIPTGSNPRLVISAGQSGPNTNANGVHLLVSGNTYIDTSTASSGTANWAVGTSFGGMAFAASNPGVTYTSAATVLISGAPAAGTNATITNSYALHVAAGNTYLGGMLYAQGGLSTSTSSYSGNFSTSAGSAPSLTGSISPLLFGGASTASIRTNFYGNTSSTLGSGASYSNVVVGSAPITTASSGTHAVLANMVVNPVGTVTNSGATVTTTATLYVNGAATGGTNNYALYSPSGNNFFGGRVAIQAGSFGSSWLTVGGVGGISPWGTTGAIFNSTTSTIADNSTASGGTVSGATTFNSFQVPTLAAANTSVTYSGPVSTVYIAGAPTAGTNTAITNPYSLYVATGATALVGGLQTSSGSTLSNLFVPAGAAVANSGQPSLQLAAGSTVASFHAIFNGNGEGVVSAGNSYGNVIVGSSPIVLSNSGTNPILANLAVNPVGAVTGSGASAAATASLYVNGSGAGGTNNYTQFNNGGTTRLSTGMVMGRTGVADADYTIFTSDYIVGFTSLSSSRTVTLPSTGLTAGQEFIIKDESGNANTNNITVAGTIDGAANKIINTAYGIIRLYYNGAAWFTW